jgi:hypothetical protein
LSFLLSAYSKQLTRDQPRHIYCYENSLSTALCHAGIEKQAQN